jgi:transposase
VYIDETGIQKHLTRDRLLAKRGTVYAEKIRSGHRRERVNVIGALRGNQMIALDSFVETCNSELFNTWPNTKAYPKFSADDVLIMDNAPFHVGNEIVKIAKRHSCKVLFLPPYSPELNPIEHYWAHLKARLKNFTGSVLSSRFNRFSCKR